MYGTTLFCPGSSGSPATSHSRQAVARNASNAPSCTASSAASSWRVAVTTSAPAPTSATRIASALAGISTAGVLTPTQISASGSCSRWSSDHTSGSESVMAATL